MTSNQTKCFFNRTNC